MPTLEQIQEQLKRIDGISHLLGSKEVKELPSIMWEDEDAEHMVQGIYNNGLGVLFATNKRLIFVDKGMFFGLKVEDFPYDKIASSLSLHRATVPRLQTVRKASCGDSLNMYGLVFQLLRKASPLRRLLKSATTSSVSLNGSPS